MYYIVSLSGGRRVNGVTVDTASSLESAENIAAMLRATYDIPVEGRTIPDHYDAEASARFITAIHVRKG